MARIGIKIRFIWVVYIAGIVASRAQWRFGIFAVGLQMAMKLNEVKLTSSLSSHRHLTSCHREPFVSQVIVLVIVRYYWYHHRSI